VLGDGIHVWRLVGQVERLEIPARINLELEIFRIQEISPGQAGGDAVEDDRRLLVFQGLEAERAQPGIGIALVFLQAALVGGVDFAIGDDQVGVFGAPDQFHPGGVHRRLQGRVLQAGGAGDRGELVFPERPGAGVDAADDAKAVIGHHRL
jgi:hypothetical protein